MGEKMMGKGGEEMGWRELYKGKSSPDDLCNIFELSTQERPNRWVARKEVVADIIPLNNTRRNTCLFTIGQVVVTAHENVCAKYIK